VIVEISVVKLSGVVGIVASRWAEKDRKHRLRGGGYKGAFHPRSERRSVGELKVDWHAI
jgi:hypothetical protein